MTNALKRNSGTSSGYISTRRTRFITEKSFASTQQLADAIIAFLAARNENPRRYVWKAKGEEILRKINAARQALATAQTKRNSISRTAH